MKNQQSPVLLPILGEAGNSILDSITDAIISVDTSGNIIYSNIAARKITGNKNVPFSKSATPEWISDIIAIVLKKSIYFQSEKFHRQNGLWYEINGYPVAEGATILIKDISERKNNEKRLMKLADRNSTIIETMRDSFLLTDEDLNVKDVNPAFCETSGYTREELLTMNATDFDMELSKEKIKKNLKSALENGTVLFDTKNKKKSGEIIDVEVTLTEMIIEGKNYFASFGRDISNFKKAQQELNESNERFELIGRTTQDSVWEVNMENGKRWANEMHQRMYGKEKHDDVPTSREWEDRIHPDEKKSVIKSLKEAIKSKRNIWLEEYRFKTDHLGWIYIYDRTYLVYNKKKSLVRMLGSMLDITDLKKAEEEIYNQKRLSDLIINSLPGIFYLYDEHGQCLKWNKNAEAISGYTSAEIASMKPLDLVPSDERDIMRQKISEILEKGSVEIEGHLLTKSGKKIPFFFTGWLTNIDGRTCILGTGLDITQIKKTEIALYQMKQEIMEQKVQEQKKISRTIISSQEKQRDYIGRELHDNVNQILAGARLYLSMASKKGAHASELVKYPLELVDSAITEIRSLTHRYVTPLKDVDLKPLVQTLLDNISKNSEIKTTLTYHAEEKINEDLKVNIYRIIQEQINNIVKHAGATRLDISIQACAKNIVINLADNGKGFNVNKKRDGIGLSNITTRVNSYDGNLDIQSTPGNGCTVNIHIPIAG